MHIAPIAFGILLTLAIEFVGLVFYAGVQQFKKRGVVILDKLVEYRCHGERNRRRCNLILCEAPAGQHIKSKCRGCKTLHEFFPDGSITITYSNGKTQTLS